ncbi:di-heme oxidoredictase family protein [Mesobacterium sp. TK19101]|uniref:Di-heme oxidoredictase family protein n=1 Tax=Mesobacterium hydrothermale TaxID=3111907 RepID=A0ABU6HDB4_9RHOB|nr:di-heme oxidoredictase family protein [Mesobacterium sp. TK19101]MEC3860276.1 di-heme oxidoredictase family protein [Mesobacterium sp. TK19101]
MKHPVLVLSLGSAVLAMAALALSAEAETKAQPNARLLAPTTDFSRPEQFETQQGGTGTTLDRIDQSAFSHPSAMLTATQRAEFAQGNEVFDREWVAAPSSTIASDGLGPYFNARSCQGCHINGGRGHPPLDGDTSMVSMLFALSDGQGAPDPVFGHQFQDQAIAGFTGEGTIRVVYESVRFTYPDGTNVDLRRPVYSTDAALAAGVALNPRIAPQMIGLGLIEAIDQKDILSRADPDDADGDGISGRAHWLGDGALGRFGWKATTGSVMEQSALAFFNDMSLSTWMFPAPHGDCTTAQETCRTAEHGDDDGLPEVDDGLLDSVSFYSANLAVPARRGVDDPRVLEGKALFYAAGCVSCHVPKHATGENTAPELRNQVIWPYSDFLLHDLGPGLADTTPTGDVAGSEWRTPPLWGIGMTAMVSGHTNFLHDGRARSLEEAILWHGGEAESARDSFAGFLKEHRASLLHFLNSL